MKPLKTFNNIYLLKRRRIKKQITNIDDKLTSALSYYFIISDML